MARTVRSEYRRPRVASFDRLTRAASDDVVEATPSARRELKRASRRRDRREAREEIRSASW